MSGAAQARRGPAGRYWLRQADPAWRRGPAAVYGAKPAWSPDGSTILFAAHGGPAPALIAAGADPAWSPDGAAIAFGRIDRVSLGALRR